MGHSCLKGIPYLRENFFSKMSDELSRHLTTYLELQFWASLEGDYPTKEEIKERFALDDNSLGKLLPLSITALKNRGLSTESLEEMVAGPPVKILAPKNEMDPVFVLCCNLICDTYDKRSLAAKLKSLEVTSARWKAFLKNPKQRKYFEERLNDSFSNDTHLAAKSALASNVAGGDLQSIKYYMELTNKYRPGVPGVGDNLGKILALLMEILVRYVSAQDLNKIADEIEIAFAETKELTA